MVLHCLVKLQSHSFENLPFCRVIDLSMRKDRKEFDMFRQNCQNIANGHVAIKQIISTLKSYFFLNVLYDFISFPP